ncbi:Gluconolactonase [Mannheimia haemolytica]|uniref:Gluconolactonase n=1 Tax=Mannheimia haemolytica TaxID=75985 RepID=A0A3S4YDM3_MANHA|nr:SMP-30/gluconolactonase/LRE family protein [Mannheimia haemolytica]VEI74975.1 Gluconolactonase [Mannheimia haemolytica]
MKKFTTTAIVLAFATLGVACSPIHHTIKNTRSIQTATLDTAQEIAQLSYIENLKSPEDLVQIPNSNWIIASGMTHHSGLYLIDSQTKTAQRLIAPKADKPSTQFKNSQPQPHADEMQIHGLSIRAMGGGKSLLYAVNHNGFDKNINRETIEVFEVNANTTTPTIKWLGNVPMPKDDKGRYLAANSVVSGADGSIYTTVMMHPHNTLEDMFAGKTTGAIYRWSPKTQVFEKLQGTEFNGNNGIELSPDGQFIYVAHMKNLSKLTNTNPAKEVATTQLNYGVFDNLHWVSDKLITAGSSTQNCGDTMTYDCLKDYHITTISPDNLSTNAIYQGKYTADFSGVSTVLPVGKTYYLGSFYRDKMAYFVSEIVI